MKRFSGLVAAVVCALAVGCGGGNEEVEQAVAACKSSVDAQPTLSADVKNDLKALCDEAKDGDVEEVRKASLEICNRVVEESGLPAEAQAQAKATCEAATANP